MYHKHLQRQLQKFLGPDLVEDKRLSDFLHAVSESYGSYERDRELSEHAFSVNEAEYQSVNRKLTDLTQNLEEKIKFRTKELEDIAQFPLENPNPIFRVCIDGDILFKNEAAGKIKNLVFESKKYTTKVLQTLCQFCRRGRQF